MVYDDARETDVASLEKLAAELGSRGFEARLLTPEDRLPSLVVTNPQAAMLGDTIRTGTEWFWWPWGDRIAPVSDAAAAAGIIARVLGSS